MSESIKKIGFDHQKHPGIDFDVLSLDSFLDRDDLDHK